MSTYSLAFVRKYLYKWLLPIPSSLVATESFGTYPGELNIKPKYFLHAVTSELVLTAATMSVPSEHNLYGATRNISRKAYKVFMLATTQILIIFFYLQT